MNAMVGLDMPFDPRRPAWLGGGLLGRTAVGGAVRSVPTTSLIAGTSAARAEMFEIDADGAVRVAQPFPPQDDSSQDKGY